MNPFTPTAKNLNDKVVIVEGIGPTSLKLAWETANFLLAPYGQKVSEAEGLNGIWSYGIWSFRIN